MSVWLFVTQFLSQFQLFVLSVDACLCFFSCLSKSLSLCLFQVGYVWPRKVDMIWATEVRKSQEQQGWQVYLSHRSIGKERHCFGNARKEIEEYRKAKDILKMFIRLWVSWWSVRCLFVFWEDKQNLCKHKKRNLKFKMLVCQILSSYNAGIQWKERERKTNDCE